ncbi:MAG: MFS transporter [Ardenticatenia bacterium]|nr:MFS transporter [Ardenticatenia bacterium]
MTALALPVHATTISRWFARDGRRGLAIGLAFSGTGIGVMVLAPVIERAITVYGWRFGYLLLAALLAGISLPLTWWLLQDRPEAVGLRPDGFAVQSGRAHRPALPAGSSRAFSWGWRQAASTLPFWLVLLAGALSLFTLRMVTVHQVAYFVDRGIARRVAATLFGSTGLITATSFVLFGRLSDHIGRARAFHLGAAFQVGALVFLLNIRAQTPVAMLFGFVLLWGLGEGSRSGLLTAIASDLFPGPALGAIVGSLGAMFGVGAALGSWLGGVVYDLNGSYTPAFILALAATLVASACIEGAVRTAHPPSSPVGRRATCSS